MSLLLGTRIALLAAGGAALFRLRGSDHFERVTGRGATTARIVWAVYLASAAWAVDQRDAEAWTQNLYLVAVSSAGQEAAWTHSAPLPVLLPLLALALWLGAVGGWWSSLGVLTPWEVARHSARGVLWVGPVAALVTVTGLSSPWPLLLAGAACGPVYLACRLLWPRHAVPAAEWAWGGLVAAALLLGVA